MKYDINSRVPKYWNTGHLGKLFKNMKEKISDRTLKKASYIIGRNSLLENDSIVEYDQKPHLDYACRLRKT